MFICTFFLYMGGVERVKFKKFKKCSVITIKADYFNT